jgi:hypothetical protein
MADPVDIKLQIAFGLSGIISIIIAIANLHPKNSLGAEWFRSIRACVRGTGRRTHRHDDIISNEDMWQEDEESSVAMLKPSISLYCRPGYLLRISQSSKSAPLLDSVGRPFMHQLPQLLIDEM